MTLILEIEDEFVKKLRDANHAIVTFDGPSLFEYSKLCSQRDILARQLAWRVGTNETLDDLFKEIESP